MKTKQATTLVQALALAFGGLALLPAAQAQQAQAAADQRIEITGSRLKRAETEGALPITVIDRAAIEASGQISVAELMRTVTFSSFGNFKPQSGSSAQALSDIDLRGLGSNRTLVLLDGRRISKAPFSGQAQDLNSLPLAAIERIEILSDGASAVYGSDAIGGVVNLITRKNYNGVEISYGEGNPDIVGGDTKNLSLIVGTSGTKGRILAGFSSNERAMIYTRNQQGGNVQGVSTFGNNFYNLNAAGTNGSGAPRPVPGFDCTKNNFWFTAPGAPNNICSFNFNAIAANEAAIGNKSLFMNGDFNINDDWSVYTSASITNVESFGRYAPTPVGVKLEPTSPAYLAITAATPGLAAAQPRGLWLRHRMAAAGPRDSSTDATVTAALVGVRGRLFNTLDVELGGRAEKYKYKELGKNYIVRPLLQTAIANGSYDIFDPFNNSADVLNGIKNTITRDDLWDSKELYGTVSMELFKIGRRAVTGLVGFEDRKEIYADIYDPLSEAGLIEGSAGNSASGSRKVTSAFFEIAAPVLPNLELSLAGRHDDYSDSGSRFSPKVSGKWQPMKRLTVRASYGEGFRAPTLDVLTQKPAFSADSITDLRTCLAFGRTPAQCGDANNDGIPEGVQPQIQVDATVIANPGLLPETSKQFSLGLVFDATDWLSLKLDVYNIKIDGRITNMGAQTIINRTLNPALGAVPAAFSVTRDPTTGQITNVTRGAVNEGTLETNGFDANIRTDFKLGGFGRLANELQYSQVQKYTLNGGRNLVGDQGTPKFRWVLNNTWSWQRVTANLGFNHIASQPDPFGGLATKSYTTANAALTYEHPTKTKLTVGVLNLENKYPELLGYDGRPWNFYLYDGLGRTVYFRLTQAF